MLHPAIQTHLATAGHAVSFLIDVRAAEGELRRRGRSLATLLLGTAVVLTLLIANAAFLSPLASPNDLPRATLAFVSCLAAVLLLFLLNRRGHIRLVGYLALVLWFVAISVTLGPLILDHMSLMFAVPILTSSIVISPSAALAATLFATACYTGLALAYPVHGEFDYLTLLGLFLLASVCCLATAARDRALANERQALARATAEITERERAERQVRERMNELQVLYGLSELDRREGITLDELYQELVDILPSGWQHNAIACAKAVIGDREYQTESFGESSWKLCAPIKVSGLEAGRIEVGYLEGRPEEDEGPFLKEERMLLDAIAERVGRITERHLMYERLVESEAQFRDVAEMSPALVTILQGAHCVYTNPAAEVLTGYSYQELATMRVEQLIHEQDRASMLRRLRAREKGKTTTPATEFRLLTKSGEIRWLETRSSRIQYRGRPATLSVGADVTERKTMEDTLQRMAHCDALTGLHNRAYLDQQLHHLRDARPYPVSLVIIDVDGLKSVNDTMGHDAGDKLLQALAEVLRTSMRKGDIVARMGGDEFSVILPDTSEAGAQAVCQRLERRIRSHNRAHHSPRLRISYGAHTVADPNCSLDDGLKLADQDMLRNKTLRRAGASGRVVLLLSQILDERDNGSSGRTRRAREFALRLDDLLSVSRTKRSPIKLLTEVHDIGMIGVPNAILGKQGPLTPTERQVMQNHCEVGYRLALSCEELAPVADLILHHHEAWDGSGYPHGLRGEETPLACRIVLIADAYAAMTSDRPYRKPMPFEQALCEIERCSGSQFDPRLAQLFVEMIRRDNALGPTLLAAVPAPRGGRARREHVA